MKFKTRYCLLFSVALLTGGPVLAGDDRSDASASLQAKFGPRFVVGVALGGQVPDDYTPAERKLILEQFGSVTPENCMKMTEIQPREGEFHFEQADALVAFARQNRLQVVGHTLVWAKDERTPAWVFLDGDKPASRALVLERMQTHIRTVVSRYRGQVASWDVVNEVLDDGEPYLRPSQWLTLAGPEFVAKAFAWAHKADPDALLVYNDYNVELIGRVTFWDLHDGRSWLNTFPWKHAEYPLLFDREAVPKPAFKAVMGVQ